MFALTFLFAVLTFTNPVKAEDIPNVGPLTGGNIDPGVGYSTDLQQIAPLACYNVSVQSVADRVEWLKLDSSMSSSELENDIGVHVSVEGKYAMFSADATAEYMRSMKETDNSLSLNYYAHYTCRVQLNLTAGGGENALTASAKEFYNGGKNPQFGLVCGDNIVYNYKKGALLILGLSIKFNSAIGKQAFQTEVGVSYQGGIFSASGKIQAAVNQSQSHITGSVSIQAYQMGGDPTQLSKILSKDASGHYHALSCSLTSLDACVDTADGLLNYAVEEFPKQLNDSQLTPLGVGFIELLPIERINLPPPESFVTDDVERIRHDLSRKLKENEYYQNKLHPFLNGEYPVKLTDDFIRKANAIMSRAKNNVLVLMRRPGGAVDCYHYPNKCVKLKASIDSELRNITESDLEFIEDIKYIITVRKETTYNRGGRSGDAWDSQVLDYAQRVEISVSEDTYLYRINQRDGFISHFNFTGQRVASNGSSWEYIGPLYLDDTCLPNQSETVKISPFYFKAYDGKDEVKNNVTSEVTG